MDTSHGSGTGHIVGRGPRDRMIVLTESELDELVEKKVRQEVAKNTSKPSKKSRAVAAPRQLKVSTNSLARLVITSHRISSQQYIKSCDA